MRSTSGGENMDPSSPVSEAAFERRLRLTHELVLGAVLLGEIVVVVAISTNFLTSKNAFEITRLLVEVVLLAVAMTPVIITGGIDLSVGSLMGLSAVLLGMMWRDADLSMKLAVPLTLLVGAAAGLLNGLLITRLRLPPLIVTLGTFSLFRGLGEGLTRGVENYTGFSERFLFLGQGYLPGGIPAQLPIFVVVVIGFWILLQRSTIGRGIYAIGFSPEGARHAGIPVERRLTLVYLLSGNSASLAAIIYVSHWGQAKADAGTEAELAAITAVVLGGTSIFGGRGTIQGTVLGLLAITVLKNGLQLAALPGYFAGILMGGLLLVTISMERLGTRGARAAKPIQPPGEEFEVRNSQVAVLSLVILLGALIVAGSNWLLIRDLQGNTSSNSAPHNNVSPSGNPPESNNTAVEGNVKNNGTPVQARGKKVTVAMMPKSLGNAYFIACKKGAEE